LQNKPLAGITVEERERQKVRGTATITMAITVRLKEKRVTTTQTMEVANTDHGTVSPPTDISP